MNLLRKTVVIILLIFTSIACSNNKDKPIIVGTSADAPPFEFIDSKGEFDGFDIELMRIIAQRMNKKVQFVHIDFSDLLSSLQSGKIDFAISSITSTQERKNMFDFSVPYLFDDIVAITKKDSPFSSIAGLRDAIIGVQRGTLMESWIRLVSLSSIKSISMDSSNELMTYLDEGKINVFLLDKLNAQSLIKTKPSLRYFDVGTSADGYAIAMKKDTPYKAMIDPIIEKLEKDGTLAMLSKKWLVHE